MITLYKSGSGADDFSLLQLALSEPEWSRLRGVAKELLSARGHKSAARMLSSANFRIWEATNHFGDDFCVLYEALPIDDYVKLERSSIGSGYGGDYHRIADAVSEIGPYIRFVAVGMDHGDVAVDQIPSPDLEGRPESVQRAIIDAQHLLETTGASSAVDRVHTALHGYLRSLCRDIQCPEKERRSVSALFNLLRKQHPAFSNLGSRPQETLKMLRALGALLDALGTIRNQASMAHPTENLIQEAEAVLAVNATRTVLWYLEAKIRALEPQKVSKDAAAQATR